MREPWLTIHSRLGGSRRIAAVAALQRASATTAAEWAVLIFMGTAAAALSAWFRLDLGIPGHNIIRVVFPFALGLSLVPRYGAATVMSASGTAAGGLMMSLGARGLGVGAMTSLALTGVLLDSALAGARSGRSIYVRLALAGLAANGIAFAVRLGMKLLLGQPLASWLPRAVVTYTLCGLIAGLISAAVWFRATWPEPDAASGTNGP